MRERKGRGHERVSERGKVNGKYRSILGGVKVRECEVTAGWSTR